jgi:hypothetical protein
MFNLARCPSPIQPDNISEEQSYDALHYVITFPFS